MEQDTGVGDTSSNESLPEPQHSPIARDNAANPGRLLMTSDLRAATGISRTHLDYYLREELVRPAARTESGYLLFDSSEVELLRVIIEERRAGRPLRDIRNRIGR